jgi:hypothetical protein
MLEISERVVISNRFSGFCIGYGVISENDFSIGYCIRSHVWDDVRCLIDYSMSCRAK